MNQLSLSSPSPTQHQQQQQQQYSATSTRRTTPAIIPLDYNYQTMSPSTHRASMSSYSQQQLSSPPPSQVVLDLDNQYSSLFGDPVPPPPSQSVDYFGDASQIYRAISIDVSSDEDVFGARIVSISNDNNDVLPAVAGHRRLFSNVPYSTTSSRRTSQDPNQTRNFDILPRLEPPDIQILPNSSGGSSTEQIETPNFALLAPHDILTKPALYDFQETENIAAELLDSYLLSDAQSYREYVESTRRLSNMSEDFKSNVGSLCETHVLDAQDKNTIIRQFSNESYSSAEWFRPVQQRFPEFSKIPKLRPSSKNIMSIKREEMPHSPLAAMIQDSNGSSSGEERLLDATQTLEHATVSLDVLAPARPPDPTVESLREMEDDVLLTPKQYLRQQLQPEQQRRVSNDSLGPNYPATQPPSAAPPIPPAPATSGDELSQTYTMQGTLSPAIIKDSIATGGDYRVDQLRLHKKTAFTIITDKSPQSSRAQSPKLRRPSKQSTTSSTSTKPIAKPRYHLQRKSLTSTQLKLPRITDQYAFDDSPRPSVQFNMSGRYSPSKMPQKGILQHRESLTSSQDTFTPIESRRSSSITPATGSLPRVAATLSYGQKNKSCEMLPLITDSYRTAIPRLNRSTLDVSRESAVIPPGALPRPLKPNPNPTRKQRGLLRVMVPEESTSRIPLRSNWASMDDLAMEKERKFSLDPLSLQARRRSSSTSPERRSSTLTASDRRSSNLSTVTTSDFSFRRPSVTTPTQRRKSIHPTTSPLAKRRPSTVAPSQLVMGRSTPRTKIAKPTTLSPIIGTPNKDSGTSQSPTHTAALSDTISDVTSRRDSLSKIPVRQRSDSIINSQPTSRSHSRSNSPLKEFTSQLPLSGLTSRATSSRSPSRATARSTEPQQQPTQNSRANSRAASRSTSRASTKQISRGPSRASDSRPNSRMEQAKEMANSRADSRLSIRSTARSSSISPAANNRRGRGTTPNRRKSMSLSPQTKHTPLVPRKQTQSPTGAKIRATSLGRSKSNVQRQNSQSRIPTRAGSQRVGKPLSKAEEKSPKKTKVNVASNNNKKKSRNEVSKSSTERKQIASAKKMTPSHKPDASIKRTTSSSSVGKQATVAKKQISNIKREQSNLISKNKKEVTPYSKEVNATKAITRAASTLSIKKGKASTTVSEKKTPSKGKQAAVKEIDAKKDLKAPVAEQVSNAILQAAEVLPTAISSDLEKAASSAANAVTGGLKRSGTNLAKLARMGSRMSIISRKRTDSAQSRREPTLHEVPHGILEESGGDNSNLNKEHSVGEASATMLPSANILEKSQKTLETVQKTVTVATDEIHKTINENLSDLKSLETDIATGRMSDSAASPTPSVATVVDNRKNLKQVESASRIGTADGSAVASLKSPGADSSKQKSPIPPSQPIEAAVSVLNADHINASANGGAAAETAERVSERAISVLPEVDCESANFQNFAELGIDDKTEAAVNSTVLDKPGSGDDFKADAKRRSPDGQGGSIAGSGNGKTGSQEFLEDKEDEAAQGCCRCCTKLCMPCRRSRCSRCCRRNKSSKMKDETEEQPVLSATSSATTTNLEVIDETATAVGKPKKKSCWQKLNCCEKKPKKVDADSMESEVGKVSGSKLQSQQMETIREEMPISATSGPPKKSKCGLCLSKIFCCRSVNKVDTTTGDETEVNKCCFCIPCRGKRSGGARGSTVGSVGGETGSNAWQDPERGITATDASVLEGGAETVPKVGCCKRFWGKLLCCRKKVPAVSDARRQSIRVAQPTEDTRKKLHIDLVEYNSKMKGAIPVLPLYLAWFCAICNTVFPGLGTLISGFFCICVGIPRFSQYDSAKARIGSLIINIIVAMAQFFCVLFCFVGWGWSIWWGTIMLKCAKKLSKIRKVERLEMEEEQRQAAAAAAVTVVAAKAAPHAESETAKT